MIALTVCLALWALAASFAIVIYWLRLGDAHEALRFEQTRCIELDRRHSQLVFDHYDLQTQYREACEEIDALNDYDYDYWEEVDDGEFEL